MERSEDSVSSRSERSRPSTPKWWRPNYPPETYLWEEIRRQRQKGGYPWTLLDKGDDDENEDFGDHLYEPVNPPPLYGSGYVGKDPDTGSLDGRLLDIPPEMDIVSSEGLDGLDKPDPHDLFGIDGDKEWHLHPEEEKGFSSMKTVFTAGIRKRNLPKSGETSSIRPLTNKETGKPAVEGAEAMLAEQVVPRSAVTPEPEPEPEPETSTSKPSAFDQLKSKAGKVKQRISKISLPDRPKLKNWSGMKLMKRKKPKEEEAPPVEMEDIEQFEQRVPEPDEIIEPHSIMKGHEAIPGRTTPLTIPTEQKQISFTEEKMDTNEEHDEKAKKDKEDEAARQAKAKEQAEKQEQDRLKREAEMLKKEEAERIKAEEKLQKELAQEEQKKLKLEAKLQKEKALEEQKRAKAEEKAAKEKAAEEQKRIKAEEKLLKEQQEEEQKKAKLEEKLLKDLHEEELKKMKLEAEAAEKKLVTETPVATPNPVDEKIRALEQFEYDMESEIIADEKPQTPTPKKPTTTEIIKRKLADIDLKNRFKRSKTPPPRPEQPKFKFTRRGKGGPDPLENKLGAQYQQEIAARQVDMESERSPEPQIFVTQASVDTTESETHGEWLPPSQQRAHSETVYEEEDEGDGAQKEKFGDKLKGFGQKSKAIAAQTSKGLGKKMKVIGKDIKQFGGKVNVKCKETIKEIRATQEAARNRGRREKAEEPVNDETPEQPRQTFRFKKRPREDEEVKQYQDNDQPVIVGSQKKVQRPVPSPYENRDQAERSEPRAGPSGSAKEPKISRNQVLGRAERDWESPLDITHSRDASEEPGNMSSGWETPPGSSIASSSVQPSRRPGVLEEIDSDEFFLRERGISEGEDEEEVNRLLVEELRQAFRPTHANALAGFDLATQPERPTRAPRKAPRKGNQKPASSFQTFPPERPKRKQTAGYISSYMEANGGTSFEDEQEPPAFAEDEDDADLEMSEEDEDEGIRRVKEELRKIDQAMEDDGRYEPVSDSPQRPQRSKKRKPRPPSPPVLYYNTIAANKEWIDNLEDQMIPSEAEINLGDEAPVPPKRKTGRRSGSQSQAEGSEIQFADEDLEEEESVTLQRNIQATEPPLAQAESAGQFEDLDDMLDFMDESGYAVVQKDPEPTTVPRRKKRGGKAGNSSAKRHSLKRRSQNAEGGPIFFSLPRYTPRTFHIVPPSRPHRTYSTLRPKRPPRHKLKSSPNLRTEDPPRSQRRANDREGPEDSRDSSRPSTAIGIMQGRPLPAPPRPERSPIPPPQNDLDQASIERMVGVRHYANFDDDEVDTTQPQAVVEELCVKKNIYLCGHEDGDESAVGNSDVNVAIQTDPLREEEFDLNAVGSFEEEEDRIQRLRDSIQRVSSDDRDQEPILIPEERYPPAIPARSSTASREVPAAYQQQPMQVIFPTRLHLNELEVDFLRVNELTAGALTMDRLETPHLQASSLSSTGPLTAPLIQSTNLTTDHLLTDRLSSNNTDLSGFSIPPPSFYQLASPPPNPNPCPVPEEVVDSLVSGLGPGSGQFSRPPRSTPPTSLSRSPTEGLDADDVLTLSMRLGRALLRVGMRTIHSMVDYIDSATSNDPECQQQQRANLQVMLCLLLLLVTGIFLMTRSGSAPPRWEFYLPPPDL